MPRRRRHRPARPIPALLVAMAGLSPAALLGSCTPGPSEGSRPSAATRPAAIDVPALESMRDGATHDLPGVPHVLVQAADHKGGVLSGALPEGDRGFATLAALGVKTVISVDAAPVDADSARAHGLRYVQIPTEYAGISARAAEQLAVALRDVEGPVYIHCHHGKHRAPAAAALALVEVGALTNEEALARLEAAGTSPNYPGLFECVEGATAYSAETLAALSAPLPEQAEVGSLAGGMAVIDRSVERLELVKRNGWRVPEDHPDLSPVALAATVESNLRALSHMPSGGLTPPIENWQGREAFIGSMRDSAARASELESAIAGTDWPAANTAWDALQTSCTACHRAHRNGG